MPWEEFCDLVAGLGSETPLGKMVQIRTETDAERLKTFTPEMMRIRNEWISGHGKVYGERERDKMLKSLLSMFKNMEQEG